MARAVNGLTRTVSFPGHVSVPDSVNPSIDHFQQDHIHDLCNNVADNDIIVWTLVFDFMLDYKKFVPYRLTLKFNVNSTLRYICSIRKYAILILHAHILQNTLNPYCMEAIYKLGLKGAIVANTVLQSGNKAA